MLVRDKVGMGKSNQKQIDLLSGSPPVPRFKKLCPKCYDTKWISEFSSRSAVRHLACSYCRSCQREYCRQHYRAMRQIHNSRRYKRQIEGRKAIFQRIRKYKQGKSCVDCGESDPVVLEFDHVRGSKRADIGRMTQTSTWLLTQEEIAKCDLRCATCHRRKTAQQLGWKVHSPFAERLE